MSNKNMVKVNGKNIKIVDLGTANNTRKKPVNSATSQPIQSTKNYETRKMEKDEVNLLEDSDSTSNDNYKQNDDPNKLIRLSHNDEEYKKYKEKQLLNPKASYISAEDIKDKLKFYNRVKAADIPNIKIGAMIKYIQVLDDGTYKYRPGGILIVNKAPDYLVLTAKRKSWSVQLDTHIIFSENFGEVRKNYEQRIKNLTNEIEQLKKSNKCAVAIKAPNKTNNVNKDTNAKAVKNKSD